jgi:hypothetical protein
MEVTPEQVAERMGLTEEWALECQSAIRSGGLDNALQKLSEILELAGNAYYKACERIAELENETNGGGGNP